MAQKIKLYIILSQMMPRGVFNSLSSLIIKAGFSYIDPRKYAGFMILFTLIAAVLSGYVAQQFYADNALMAPLAAVSALVLVSALFYFVLYSSAENRARNVEDILPEALKIIAANIRAGMTIENAIWSVSKPEFGVFGQEIKRVSISTYAGKSIREALEEMTKRVDSKMFERSVHLLSEGIRLGGEMANLLDEVADTIKATKALRKEIMNATITYSLFIIFSAILVAPMLFSVSLYYTEINERLLAKQMGSGIDPNAPGASRLLSGDSIVSMSFQRKSQGVTADDIRLFSLGAISITAFFSSLLLGQIQHGNAKRGVKFIPVFVPIALGIFYLIHSVLVSAFANIMV
ncbi:MAG: type II secretion system F family protein [Candidatus Micrarchaeota archaeon]